jgi:hypothetical protein
MSTLTVRATRRARTPGQGRLLRIELRRSAMLLLLPALAGLLWFFQYRRAFGTTALWSLRSSDMQDALGLIGPFVAGVAAWMASRDRRRRMTDLVGTAARPRWTRQLTTWAAVAAWALAFYAAATAVLFAVTARQATWGGPIWWPVGIGAAGILAFAAAGFAIGTVFSSRFAAPLVTIGSVLAMQVGALALTAHHSPYGWLSPANQSIRPGSAIFFSFDPSVAIVQLIFLAGVAAAALGAVGLPAASGGPWTRRAAAAVAAAGILAAGTGVALAGTAREQANNTVIPLLHDAAAGQAIGYTAVCDRSAVPVCVQPAFRPMLATVAAAVDPVTAQVAGLPGAPVRVAQLNTAGPSVATSVYTVNEAVAGRPPVLYIAPFPVPGQVTNAEFASDLRMRAAEAIVGGDGGRATDAQQAVASGLTIAAGGQQPQGAVGARAQLDDAGHRFAALPAPVRRAWLATHLAALRAGRVTLKELP